MKGIRGKEGREILHLFYIQQLALIQRIEELSL
jgi:hypothetical protein